MKNLAKTFLKDAFTLIELVVVIGVVGILTAATVPTFNGITSTQNLKRSVDTLESDIQLTKAKSLAGTISGNNDDIFWGIKCKGGTGNYVIGYADTDISGNPGNFHEKVSKTLNGNAVFLNDGSCDSIIFFDKLTGELKNIDEYNFKLEAGTEKTSVNVQRAGQIGAKKKFCGDGKADVDAGEKCDPGGTSSPNLSTCEAGYGEECTYCSLDCTTIETNRGPYCGDGIWQKNEGEECDVLVNGVSPNVGISACNTIPYGQECSYCDITKSSNSCNVVTIGAASCNDGTWQKGSEACDPSGKTTDNKYNQPKWKCKNVGYGKTCYYCTSNTCRQKSDKGPFCGDGRVTTPNEKCDTNASKTRDFPYNGVSLSSCKKSTVPGNCYYCNSSCQIGTYVVKDVSVCGDHKVSGSERCDPSVGTGYDVPTCTPPPGGNCVYCKSDCRTFGLKFAPICNNNRKCDKSKGETSLNCPRDCKSTSQCNYNKKCEPGESPFSCSDCGVPIFY